MSIFRPLYILAIVLGLTAAPAVAETPGRADAAAIQQVIADQIEAFKRDDATVAFSYAAPVIKEKFSSPDIFMSMVRRGYDPVYRPSAYDFGALVRVHGRLVQEVFLTDRKGVPSIALYTMQQQPDGSWRISAVRLRQPSGQSA